MLPLLSIVEPSGGKMCHFSSLICVHACFLVSVRWQTGSRKVAGN